MLENRITKVRYRNFMSFADEEVELGDLTVLVGPNGAGKSNFVDGLRFLRDAVTLGLDAAMIERGGIRNVRRRTPQGGRRADIELAHRGRGGGVDFDYTVIDHGASDGDWTGQARGVLGRRPRTGVWGFHREGRSVRFTHATRRRSLRAGGAAERPSDAACGRDAFGPLARFLLRDRRVRHLSRRLRQPQPLLEPGRLEDEGAELSRPC